MYCPFCGNRMTRTGEARAMETWYDDIVGSGMECGNKVCSLLCVVSTFTSDMDDPINGVDHPTITLISWKSTGVLKPSIAR